MIKLPANHSISATNKNSQLKFRLEIEDPEIAAHFPNKPIVSAYIQMNWIEFLHFHTNAKPLKGLKDVKFKSQITPPCEVEINLDQSSLKFEIIVGKIIKTSGKLIDQ